MPHGIQRFEAKAGVPQKGKIVDVGVLVGQLLTLAVQSHLLILGGCWVLVLALCLLA
jgi:hypothetical protein